jgi:tetratricopeptide (TPR) repeat protein
VTLLILAGALLAIQPVQQPAMAHAPDAATGITAQRLFSTTGYVEHGGSENGGWFQFAFSHQRFRLPSDEDAARPLIQVVVEASRRGTALRVRYDAWAGRSDAAGGYVEYPLCALSVATGASVGDERANCPAPAEPPDDTMDRALALGLALADSQPAQARQLLGRAVNDPHLAGRLRAVALEARGSAAEALAASLPFAGEAFDQSIVDGLADYRAWLAIAPDDVEAHYSVARMLADLGGYADAEAVYRAIGRHWPDEAFNVAVRTGALYRRQGRYVDALRALDDFAAREGPQDGMKFHYHRGWTLTLLNRPQEAIEELSRGFASQPDYAYAFFMRACAYGRIGRIGEALADQERGLELIGGRAGEAGPYFRGQMEIATSTADALRRLAATHRSTPTAIACDRLWERDIARRPRSAALPPAAG